MYDFQMPSLPYINPNSHAMPLKEITPTEIEISSGEEDASGATSSPGSSVSQKNMKLIMDALHQLRLYFDCTMMQQILVYIFLMILDSSNYTYIYIYILFNHLILYMFSWTLIGDA